MNEFTYQTRIYYEDTDSGGVVYNANYIKFMERARSEWLIALGYNEKCLVDENVLFVVRSINVELLRPARLFDQLQIIGKIVKMGRVFMEFEQRIQNVMDSSLVYCTGIIKVVCVNHAFKPCAVPKRIKQEIERDG